MARPVLSSIAAAPLKPRGGGGPVLPDIRGERLETGIPGVDRRGGAHGVAGVLTVTGTRVPEAAWCSW
jgi:hypothetical protein